MRRVQWSTFGLVLPLYVGLLLTVGHYASQLEATYQPGVAAAVSAPVNYSQDRITRILPKPAAPTREMAAEALPAPAPAAESTPAPAGAPAAAGAAASAASSTPAPAPRVTTPTASEPVTAPPTGKDDGAGAGGSQVHKKKP